MKQLQSHEKLPCASLLIRINQAPLSDDNLRPLSIDEFSNTKDWITKGLFEKRPRYSSRSYSNPYIKITEQEEGLFQRQLQRDWQSIESQALLLDKDLLQDIPKIPQKGQSDERGREIILTAEERQKLERVLRKRSKQFVHQFIDETIILDKSTTMIDMMKFAQYSPDVGINFALDAIHKVPDSNKFYFGLITLNPSGDFYLNNDATKTYLACMFDWQSAVSSPFFKTSDDDWGLSKTEFSEKKEKTEFSEKKEHNYFTVFKEKANYKMNAIIEIKSITNARKPLIEAVGWTVMMLFTPDGYGYSNVFQIPLVKGKVPHNFVQESQKSDARELIIDKVKNKEFEWLRHTSILVRTFDAQREGHFKKPAEFKRIDTEKYFNSHDFPDHELKEWAYNKPVADSLKSEKKLIDQVKDKDEFQRKVIETIQNQFKIKPQNICAASHN